ncbi:MAG: hypothetical protein V2I33_16180 [Kangiellaceae bacterium]|jgi:hypothetical protein|nr:hypothetical protein [Kangiellaceae bacterium]
MILEGMRADERIPKAHLPTMQELPHDPVEDQAVPPLWQKVM